MVQMWREKSFQSPLLNVFKEQTQFKFQHRSKRLKYSSFALVTVFLLALGIKSITSISHVQLFFEQIILIETKSFLNSVLMSYKCIVFFLSFPSLLVSTSPGPRCSPPGMSAFSALNKKQSIMMPAGWAALTALEELHLFSALHVRNLRLQRRGEAHGPDDEPGRPDLHFLKSHT